MLGVFLALLVAVGPGGGSPEDQALVARLGSALYVEREAAEAALKIRGRDALPALRSAANHRDLEVRARVGSILRQVEKSLVLEATPIPLDFRDAPLADVIRRVNDRSGLHLAVATGDDPAWSGRRVNLQEPGVLPFWAAIDRLCEAGRLSYALGAPPMPGQRDGSFVFQDESAGLPEFTSDSGPFRSQLASIAYQSEIFLARPRPIALGSDNGGGVGSAASRPNRQMSIQLLVAAEPRLAITQDGPARLLEAVDERGQSFVPGGTSTLLSHSSGYFGMNSSPQVRVRVELARPDEPGRRFARIKGVVPVMVSARKPDPLVVPLAGPAGRVHRNEDVALVVRSVRPAGGDQPAAVEIVLKANPDQPRPPADEPADPTPSRTDVPQQQLEVLDARGNALAWFPSATQYSGNETRLTLTIPSQGEPSAPATIRYHGIVRASTEVPFEFRDVPMP